MRRSPSVALVDSPAEAIYNQGCIFFKPQEKEKKREKKGEERRKREKETKGKKRNKEEKRKKKEGKKKEKGGKEKEGRRKKEGKKKIYTPVHNCTGLAVGKYTGADGVDATHGRPGAGVLERRVQADPQVQVSLFENQCWRRAESILQYI